MYRFSRRIYRELAPIVLRTEADPDGTAGRRELLAAAEQTVRRLTLDRHFAHPASSLFERVRTHFGFRDQEHVRRVIERCIGLAIEHRERLPLEARTDPQRCQATSRSGRPCARPPLAGSAYCPSHRHWELEDELEDQMMVA